MSSIFTRIMAGELPGQFIHEDEHCVVILTIQPIHAGHMLVIPRLEIDHWDDLPEDVAGHLMKVAQRMARALKRAFPSRRVGLVIAGLEVPHTHVHVFPVNEISDFDFTAAKPAFAEDLAKAAEALRAVLP